MKFWPRLQLEILVIMQAIGIRGQKKSQIKPRVSLTVACITYYMTYFDEAFERDEQTIDKTGITYFIPVVYMITSSNKPCT